MPNDINYNEIKEFFFFLFKAENGKTTEQIIM